MLLAISHSTEYRYEHEVSYGLMQVRLTPRSGASQDVVRWALSVEGADPQVTFEDHHRNVVELIATHPGSSRVLVQVDGEVETSNTNGVQPDHEGPAPLWLYRRSTALTQVGPRLSELANGLDDRADGDIARLHELARRILAEVAYEAGHTHAGSTAEESVTSGVGVCQDHAQIFVAASRHLGFPARYVSGYLRMDDRDDQDASHAWAEAWVDDLGWVGMDISNGISPDERYVRIASGLDYEQSAPLTGVRQGSGDETMNVSLSIRHQSESQQ